MREIKFRGKRVDNGEWAYGDIWSMPNNKTGIHEQGLSYSDDCEHPDFSPVEVIPETVGQYLPEVELYDGDKVAVFNKGVFEYNAIIQADTCNPCFVLRRDPERFTCDDEYDFIKCGMFELKQTGTIHDKGGE